MPLFYCLILCILMSNFRSDDEIDNAEILEWNKKKNGKLQVLYMI